MLANRLMTARNAFAVALLLFIALFGSATYVSPGGDTRPQDDALHYVSSAYNLAKYGTYSRSRVDDAAKVEPKYRREPLYAMVLAAALVVATDPASYNIDCLLYQRKDCTFERRVLIGVNEVLLAALLLLVGLGGRALSGSWVVGLGAAGGIALGNFFAPVSVQWLLYPELLAALLLLSHSLGLYLGRGGTKWAPWWNVISGVSLGLLVLSKAIFQYWLVLLMCAALFELMLMVWRKSHAGRTRIGLVIVVCSAGLIAGAWATRNYVQVGHFAISERAGNILLLRTMFGEMTAQEYRAALCSWGPDQLDSITDRLCKDVPREAFARINGGPGMEGSFKHSRNAMLGDYDRLEGPRGSEEKGKIRDGIGGYLSNWPKQVLLTPLFAYRGAWMDSRPLAMDVDHENSWPGRVVVVTKRFVDTLSFLMVPGFIVLIVLSLARRNVQLLWFCLPTLYGIAIHAAATHFIPRYGVPGIPVYALSLMLLLLLLARRLRRLRTGPASFTSSSSSR
jgi:hypothetical protein